MAEIVLTGLLTAHEEIRAFSQMSPRHNMCTYVPMEKQVYQIEMSCCVLLIMKGTRTVYSGSIGTILLFKSLFFYGNTFQSKVPCAIDGFQIDENSTGLPTSGFECEALSAKQTASIVERALCCHLWRA